MKRVKKPKPPSERLITGAILHGKIGGLERALEGLAALERKGGELADLREWLVRVIGVNRKMLAVFRDTGEVPEEMPAENRCSVCERERCDCYEGACDKCHHQARPPWSPDDPPLA